MMYYIVTLHGHDGDKQNYYVVDVSLEEGEELDIWKIIEDTEKEVGHKVVPVFCHRTIGSEL